MASREFGLIDVSGLADVLPDHPINFKQFSVQDNIIVPAVKPDIEQIVSAVVGVKIKDYYLIESPVGTSAEGQALTGKKLVVEGSICQKVEYVAEEPTQAVHSVHFEMPFSTYVVMPATFIAGTPVEVTGYIEDIFVSQLDKRTIFKNVTLLIDVKLI